MSKCALCGKENHGGNDICSKCEEEIYEQQWYQDKEEEENRDWQRRCDELPRDA